MKIESLKQLDQLMKLCRKQGVSAIEIDNIKFNLGPEPISQVNRQAHSNPIVSGTFDPGAITLPDKIDTEEMTDEQKLFGSSDPSVWASN